ncbi:hypothetical protein MOX91_00105 [Opitutales bacterium CLA-KB-P66]|uniref:Uncharacterized protein n=1 Tax=Intestinicryptomonas porci TaxID=2926320 RepID=A0ABU4WDF8_9BACT|nr:hypothetical protein [Opitutales bacterium CLA-KB-P66]
MPDALLIPKSFLQKHFREPCLADFEASAYKCTQVRRNPKMEGKTTLAWVALPKGKEPSVASAETCETSEYKCEKYLLRMP